MDVGDDAAGFDEYYLRAALRAGMTLAEFYRATPRETVMVIQAAQWRREDEERRQMRAAWHTANLAGLRIFGKHGQFPSLDKFMPSATRRRQQRMTPAQVEAHLEALFAGYPKKKKATEARPS